VSRPACDGRRSRCCRPRSDPKCWRDPMCWRVLRARPATRPLRLDSRAHDSPARDSPGRDPRVPDPPKTDPPTTGSPGRAEPAYVRVRPASARPTSPPAGAVPVRRRRPSGRPCAQGADPPRGRCARPAAARAAAPEWAASEWPRQRPTWRRSARASTTSTATNAAAVRPGRPAGCGSVPGRATTVVRRANAQSRRRTASPPSRRCRSATGGNESAAARAGETGGRPAHRGCAHRDWPHSFAHEPVMGDLELFFEDGVVLRVERRTGPTDREHVGELVAA